MIDYALEQLKILAGPLGIDRPDIAKCLEKAARNPDSIPAYRNHFLKLLKKEGFPLHDLPLFGPGPSGTPGDAIFGGHIVLGKDESRKLLIPTESFAEHTLDLGESGSGKSFLVRLLVPQFVERGVAVWIFDREKEHRVLLKSVEPEMIWIIGPKDDRDNFLQPPAGVTPAEWIAMLKNLFREVFYLRDGSINLLDNLLRNLYENFGVFAGSRNYPCLRDLNALIDRIEFKPGTRFSGYQESLANRFRGLEGELGETLACRTGREIDGDSARIVIYENDGMSDDKNNLYIYLKLLRLSCRARSLPPKTLRTIVVVEEAHKLYNEKISSRYDLGEGMIFGSSRTFRKRGIGFIYSDQVPSALPAPLFANVNNRFLMRTVNGKCIWRMAQSMSLTREQAESIPTIQKREFIFQSADYPEPVLARMPEMHFQYVTEEEVDRHMEKILHQLEYVPLVESLEISSSGSTGTPLPGQKKTSSARPNRLWAEIAKLLAEIGWISLSDLAAHLGNLAPWHVRRNLAAMVRQDLIELCPISFGTRGNPRTFVVLKPKGAEFAGPKYEDVRLQGKGSTEHVILQNILAEAMKNAGKTVAIEHSANGKSVDIAEISPDRTIAYELELAPAHEHVAENALKDIEAGFDEVVVITRNQAGQNEAKDRIYKTIGWEKLPRIEFGLLREFL